MTMNRTALGLFALLFSVTSISAAEAGRYVVVMKHGAASGGARTLLRDATSADGSSFAQRDVREYSIINGFAATLTAEEALALSREPGVSYVEPVKMRYAFGDGLPVASDETRNLDGQTVPFGLDA